MTRKKDHAGKEAKKIYILSAVSQEPDANGHAYELGVWSKRCHVSVESDGDET